MASDRELLQQKLLAAFQEEARDRIRVLADALAVLEQTPAPELVESVYREIHSLKGAARAVTARAIEQLCQAWESLFSALRKGKFPLQESHVTLSRQARVQLVQLLGNTQAAAPPACRALQQSLEAAARGESLASDNAAAVPDAATGHVGSDSNATTPIAADDVAAADITTPAAKAEHATETTTSPVPNIVAGNPLQRAAPSPASSPPPAAPGWSRLTASADSLKVNAAKLDTVLFKAEAMQVVKLQARQNTRNLQEASTAFLDWRRQRHEVTVAAHQLRRLQDDLAPLQRRHQQTLLDYVDWSRDHLGQWEHRLGGLAKSAERLNRELTAVVESLQRDVQALLLLPCSRLIEGMPAMLQEIAADTGKRAALQVSGETLQVDKRILDELKSPLQHLLRNAIDHGIESPAQRRAQGKAETGRIAIAFRQESATRVELTVMDDGAGLDAQALKDKAVAQQLISADAARSLSERDALQLAFLSGLSTREMITDLSGRGLGLAIVKEKVERLGGHMEICNNADAGSQMLIRLPASLSTHRALLVQVAEQTVAIPALAVERVFRQPWDQIRAVENRLTVSVGGTLLPLARLAEILALNTDQVRVNGLAKLVLLDVGAERFCLLVDEILGDQEMLVKSLGPQLRRVCNVLGVSQLGDGRLVPVLHPQDLYRSACQIQPRMLQFERQQVQASQSRILVAEDSVTSRSLLRQILESEQHEVTTVNDGVEAWEALLQRPFDLVVSDVEMPRMDGFQLTHKIRASRTLAELPVVLVTALKSPEDRERGLEAGANAYIVKSGFDQSNLLDVVRQLL